MKGKNLPISPRHTFHFIKLCYILIIIVSLFGLKLAIYPEGEYQAWLAISASSILIEGVIYATIICSVLSYAIVKVLYSVKNVEK